MYGPRGVVAAINYPVLQDVVLPQFFEMVDGTGLLHEYRKSEKKALLNTSTKGKYAEILFRSLDRPNWMRGLELSWFFVDEGRHLDAEAWNILYGRLRQPGYEHAGWVCSTPNGYDWMWDRFHPDSPGHLKDSAWFNAATFENQTNLPESYIESLMATYSGRFLRQEVYGEFVGVVDGAVFFEWDAGKLIQKLEYDPALPLYSFWDFGMGDLAVVLFAQLDWQQHELGGFVPVLRFIDELEGSDRTSGEWARVFTQHCYNRFGKLPVQNIGDPAGRQRNMVTGTSVMNDLAAHGVTVVPAQKRPVDYAIRIMNNMMAGVRLVVDESRCSRLSAALASHKWPIDSSGNRTGTKPVHDWTSHFCDAARYGVTALISPFPKREKTEKIINPGPGTYGHIVRQMTSKEAGWLGGEQRPNVDWSPVGVTRA